MKTNLIVVLVTLAGAVAANAQAGPQGGRQPQVNGAAPRTASQPVASTTEAIHLLSLTAVQTDLAMTADQWSALNSLASQLQAGSASEDQSLAAVGGVLTETQTKRLKELIVQDMGYGSLALTSIREELDLSADQTSQITTLTATFDSVKKALATATNAALSQTALTQLRKETNAGLAKILTSSQDTKLRSLAGKMLNSGS